MGAKKAVPREKSIILHKHKSTSIQSLELTSVWAYYFSTDCNTVQL